MAADVGRTTRIIHSLIVAIAGQIKVPTPYVTRGGGDILSGVLPPLFVECVRFMGSDKAKAGAMFAPALPFGSKCDYLIFAPSLRA